MKKKLLLLIGLVLAFSVTLVACGGGGGADPAANFVGTWKLSSIDGDADSSASEADIAMLEEMGFTQQITLKEDKTAVFEIFDESIQGTWEAKDASAGSLTIEGETADMKLEDGKLKIVADGTTMNFVKADGSAATKPSDDVEKEDTKETTKEDTKETTKEDSKSKDSGTADSESLNIVIADDDICTITITGKSLEWGTDPGYDMTIVNNTDIAIYVSYEWGSFSVNGKMASPWLSATIQPGKYVETIMSFSSNDIGEGIEALVDVEGVITVENNDNYNDLAEYQIKLS